MRHRHRHRRPQRPAPVVHVRRVRAQRERGARLHRPAGAEPRRRGGRPQVVAARQRQLGGWVRGEEVRQRAGPRAQTTVRHHHHVLGGQAQAVASRRRRRWRRQQQRWWQGERAWGRRGRAARPPLSLALAFRRGRARL